MAFTIYNTLKRKKEEFKEITPGEVKMYTCGPTVYNHGHVGNFRAFIFEDQLRRYLKFKGYKVTQVMNLTDVDDKIIQKCSSEKVELNVYTKPYKESFFNTLEILNIDLAEHYPEATTHIPEMTDLIQTLLDKDIAYKTEDGNIFYKISAFKDYGKLQNLDMSNMLSGGRVENDEYEKESVNDFALWKAWKPEDGDIYWETQLGKGRPGWHIECSAMSMKYLGKTFDIHTGGVDNIFPHHENEIAQSEAANDAKFVNYWMHCEHLIWDNAKMSKSLGNIIYIDGLLERGFSKRAIRYTLISTHYRQKLNFSLKLLDASQKALQRLDDFIFELKRVENLGDLNKAIDGYSKAFLNDFESAMDDDLNISRALGYLFDFVKNINKHKIDIELTVQDKNTIIETLKKVDSVLGIIFQNEDKQSGLSHDDIMEMIQTRNKARQSKDWALADTIRDELLRNKIELLDRKDGTDYKIIK